MLDCRQSSKDLAGVKWTLGNLKVLSTEEFRTWANSDGLAYDGDAYLGIGKCVNFRGIFGSSWESSFEGRTAASFRST